MFRNCLLFIIPGLILILQNQPVYSNQDSQKPIVSTAAQYDLSPPLIDMPLIPPPIREPRIIFNYILPLPTEADLLPAGDPVVQDWNGYRRDDERQILVNFETLDSNGYVPPDTNGDVGPNHFFQMVNTDFAIWDKQGNHVYGPASNQTLWQGFGGPCQNSDGSDPIVLYDHLADRWLATNLAFGPDGDEPFYECIAVSETGDPTGAWHRYGFNFEYTLPDYPKFGVWPDGYYMSSNEFYTNFGAGIIAFEREAMLVGVPGARMVYFSLPGVFGFLPADLDGPAPPEDSPNYFVRQGGGSQLQIYEFHVNWANTNNSSFNSVGTLTSAPFDPVVCNSRDCIPQPDVTDGLDALSGRLMFRLQYRNFGDYQAMVVNHTVDVGVAHAGVRWYELRNYGDNWEIHQQSTYAPDELNRWMGSIAMNANGDIALGYTVSNETTYPSIRFTGRLADDPPGVMTYPEVPLMAGSGSQTGSSNRWGDYSMMAVDPVDDLVFWHTNEYISYTGSYNWQTRTAAFNLGIIAIPNFEVDRTTGHAPLIIEFTDLSVAKPDLVSWAWDFDNNGSIDSEEQNPIWTYQNPGNFTVSLTISNEAATETITRQDLIQVFDGESALLFDGQQSYVTCPASPDLELSETVTFEAWVNPNGWGESGESGFGRILDKGGISLFIYGEGTSLNPHSLAVLMTTTGSSPGFADTPEYSLDLNRWQHVAVSYDGGLAEIKLYIDGQEQVLSFAGGQPAGNIIDNSALDLLIGNSSGYGQTFAGVIDEVRVWNTVRSDQEIETNMNFCLAGDEQGLVGYWPLNEGFGTAATDLSTNDNNGTVTETEWVEGVFPTVAVEDDRDDNISNRTALVSLYQNYPNPFYPGSSKGNLTNGPGDSPVTTISYNLSRAARIRLTVYNTAGQEIMVLSDQVMGPGLHEVYWDGTNRHGLPVSAGIYLYRLETKEVSYPVEIKRMVLLK